VQATQSESTVTSDAIRIDGKSNVFSVQQATQEQRCETYVVMASCVSSNASIMSDKIT
jgi:hypothetical protein